MTSNSQLVSIGLRVYNGEEFLAEALDSLLAQTYTHFELIISDNASTDKTEAICRKYAKKDKRIRYIRQAKNIGPTKNFDYVLKKSKGEYFMWASHDDIWLPSFIEKIMDVMLKDQNLALVSVEARYMLQDGELLPFFPEGKKFHKGLVGTDPLKLAKLIRQTYGNLIYGIYRKNFLFDSQAQTVVSGMRADVLNEIPIYIKLLLKGGTILTIPGKPLLLKRTSLNTYYAASLESRAKVFEMLKKFGTKKWFGLRAYIQNLKDWLGSLRYHREALSDIKKVLGEQTNQTAVFLASLMIYGHYIKVTWWAIAWKMKPVVPN